MGVQIQDQVVFVCSNSAEQRLELIAQAQAALREKQISSSIVKATNNLHEHLAPRKPALLVVDYLLDSYGTAVELLSTPWFPPTLKSIIWTDEPSLEVAVTLMRLGASDYQLCNQSGSIERLVESILREISQEVSTSTVHHNQPSLCAHSSSMQHACTSASAIASSEPGIAFIVGESGTGRSSFSQYIAYHRTTTSALIEIDWELFLAKSDTQYCLAELKNVLVSGSTVAIEHFDFDDGAFLELLLDAYTWFETNQVVVLLCLREPSLVHAAECQIPNIPICNLPSLNERSEDIVPLLRHALGEQETRQLPLSAELIDALLHFKWPGNVRQFISACREAYFTCKSVSSKNHAITEQQFLHALKTAHQRWLRLYGDRQKHTPSTLQVYRVFCRSGGNIARTAAILSTDVRYVSRQLHHLQLTRAGEGE